MTAPARKRPIKKSRAKKQTWCATCGRWTGVWIPPYSDKPQPPKLTRHTNLTTGRPCAASGQSVHPNVVFEGGPKDERTDLA